MELEDNCDSSIEVRHRKEKKELQAQIQALKKAAKNDKTKKKEILAEIVRLEIEMDNRHQQELLEAEQKDGLKEVHESNDNNLDNMENEVAKVKISKAQKRRDKKSQQEKERELQIKLQEKENLHGPRNQEIQEISARLKKRNLKIFAIPSDGDCLYKAVAHQMLIKKNEIIATADLRKKVASYVRQNKDDFLPFMTNPDTLEMLNDDEFEAYCDKITNTAVWGGQLEIRALSNVLKNPINIIQATGPECIEQGNEFEGPPLVITYHRHMYSLGEHYNSTCINEELPKS
ncbi:deubiquitinase OTUD6B [Ostrinia furnacalis]|uniref:deubiquitinase OTUD6B n=1 Tax=Ostrinia furnacalis TaxID=93504 RepID=UPI00103C73AC|nr:deubiquitinase OTUD6B [Ostrinia furnacalis]